MKLTRLALALLPVAAAVFAFELLRRQLRQYSLGEIIADVGNTPRAILLTALVLAALGYVAMTGYDWLALRYVRSSVPYRRSAPISVIAYGIGNALGFSLFTATPLRLRLYTAAGLGTAEVVKVITFTMVTFWLGLNALGGAVLVFEAPRLASLSGLPATTLRLIGGVLLAVVLAYLVAVWRVRRPIDWRSWRFELPTPLVALGQLLVSMVDWCLTAAVLWVLLPDHPGLTPMVFLGGYFLAQMLAVVSHVPGGLGVLEVTLIAFLSTWIPAGDTAVALVLFRVVYYLVPLAVSISLLVVLERRTLRRVGQRLEAELSPWLAPVVPRAMGIATFGVGALLFVSGSLPAIGNRLRALDRFVPLALMESSHLAAAVLGLALMILARGVAKRLDGAWHLTVWTLGGGIVFALLRGLDWEEAAILTFGLVLLLLTRRHFYRRAALLSRPFSGRWLMAVGVVLAGGIWLGLIANGNARYSEEQLWHFSLHGDAPRFLRAQVAFAVGALLFGLVRLFRGAAPEIPPPSASDRERVQSLVRESPRTLSTLALLGDKQILFDEDQAGFVMFGVSGDSWISMGDPVGPVASWPELIWRFREKCDLYDERPVFYQVRAEQLSLYLDAGLSVIKIGESARASLETFSLEGSARKELRQCARRGEREGLSLEIVPREAVPALLPELREISDEWLRDKSAAEKAFSLGAFLEDYLAQFPCALVRRQGRILAFANVLEGANLEELSIDLMRYRNDAPSGVMDYLFVQLMLWGKQQGYRNFHLGMAPLAGLEQHDLAPVWNRLGAWLFRHGEHFYNFQGLRAYKEKFSPTWEPRYLACQDGLATSRALFDVARLIAGGTRKLFTR